MDEARSSTAPSPTRVLADRLTLTVTLLFLVRFFVAEPYRIPTQSMMPTLAGPRCHFVCPHCGFHGDMLPGTGPLACANCRSPLESAAGHAVAAQRAIVLKSGTGSLRRFDVVAFKSPDQPRAAFVKRIVGLPGETIRIAGGEIERYEESDGAFVVCRKPLDLLDTCSRIVHDDRFRPAGQPTRWSTIPSENWQIEPAGYRLEQAHGDLVYRHVGPTGEPSDIDTSEPFLPRSAQPTPNRTRDLMLDLQWKPGSAPAAICIQFDSAGTSAELHATARGLRLHSSTEDLTVAGPWNGEAHKLRFGHLDGRWLAWVDGRLWLDRPARANDGPTDRTGPTHVKIRGIGKGTRITDLVLTRDVHYTATAWGDDGIEMSDPLISPGIRTYTLGRDEYLVLGDNPARSRDSRHWDHGPSLSGKLILGQVVGRLTPGSWIPWSSTIAAGAEPTGDEEYNDRSAPLAEQDKAGRLAR